MYLKELIQPKKIKNGPKFNILCTSHPCQNHRFCDVYDHFATFLFISTYTECTCVLVTFLYYKYASGNLDMQFSSLLNARWSTKSWNAFTKAINLSLYRNLLCLAFIKSKYCLKTEVVALILVNFHWLMSLICLNLTALLNDG